MLLIMESLSQKFENGGCLERNLIRGATGDYQSAPSGQIAW